MQYLARISFVPLFVFAISAGGWGQSPSEFVGNSIAPDHRVSPQHEFGIPIPGKSRLGWPWLAQRYDANRDGLISRGEFSESDKLFAALDADWDQELSQDDFDWSEFSPITLRKEAAFALFKFVDVDSNGKITAEEWQHVFSDAAQLDQSLDDEALARLMYGPRVDRIRRFREMRRAGRNIGYDSETPAPAVGTLAPDFALRTPDGKTGVSLSTYRNQKPVVLIFGNYSCGNYRTHSGSLERMAGQWKEEVEFVSVYVWEAHPVDETTSATSTNAQAGILISQPKSLDERRGLATRCRAALRLTSTMVVDEVDNRVATAYAAAPDRLYIVDPEGRIAFQGGPGPFGFNPREMEQSLALVLLESAP